MANYPNSYDNLPTDHSTGQPILASYDNAEASAINAIEAELGLQPSAAFSTVRARLDSITTAFANVKAAAYGAIGDGTTDDTLAIQNAINAVIAAGGGVVFFPRGVYRIVHQGSINGLAWALTILGDNVTLMGEGPSSILRTTMDTTLIAADGAMAAAGPTNWHDHWVSQPTVAAHPLFAISPATKGSLSITLTTPGDAVNFAVGDYILIRTGQTLTTFSEQPDSEINVITAIASGVLSLERPLAKSYVAENYPVGHANAGTPAAFGIQNFRGTSGNRALIRNLTIRDLRLEKKTGLGSYTYAATNFAQMDNLVIHHCEMESEFDAFTTSRTRNFKAHHNRIRMTGGGWHWAFSVDTGCTDAEIASNEISSAGVAYIHIHEGAARINVHDNEILNKGITGEAEAIDIRARAYDISVVGNQIMNAGTLGAAILADVSTDGGLISGNNIYAPNLVGATIAVLGSSWTVPLTNTVVPNVVQLSDQIVGPQQIATYSTWLTPTKTSAVLGRLPFMFVVESTTIYVHVAFNSSGTDLINVGQDSYWGTNAYASAIDASTLGLKTGTPFNPGVPVDVSTQKIVASYTAGGSAPTTGKALVVVRGYIVGFIPP
jgi:hypothetical protein